MPPLAGISIISNSFFEILILFLVQRQIFLKLAGALYVVSLSYFEDGSEGVYAGIAGRGASGLYLAYIWQVVPLCCFRSKGS